MMHGRLFVSALFALAIFVPARGTAAANTASPVIAIIIDDLGNNLSLDKQAIVLPGPVACAFLPDTPYAARLARAAHAAGKEVLLHLPLEALGHERLGPGGLTLPMTRHEFVTTVRADLAAIPDVDGVNNHMGSLMTQHPGDMAWLMETLKRAESPLFFVDSRTTPRTVAYQVARRYGVPATSRNVFLDDVRKPAAIKRQLQRLIDIARRNGSAVAIGHPYPVTLRVLAKQLPQLAAAGVKLVPIHSIIARQTSIEERQSAPRRRNHSTGNATKPSHQPAAPPPE